MIDTFCPSLPSKGFQTTGWVETYSPCLLGDAPCNRPAARPRTPACKISHCIAPTANNVELRQSPPTRELDHYKDQEWSRVLNVSKVSLCSIRTWSCSKMFKELWMVVALCSWYSDTNWMHQTSSNYKFYGGLHWLLFLGLRLPYADLFGTFAQIKTVGLSTFQSRTAKKWFEFCECRYADRFSNTSLIWQDNRDPLLFDGCNGALVCLGFGPSASKCWMVLHVASHHVPGIKLEDRVGTLMWNSAWHLECLLENLSWPQRCFVHSAVCDCLFGRQAIMEFHAWEQCCTHWIFAWAPLSLGYGNSTVELPHLMWFDVLMILMHPNAWAFAKLKFKSPWSAKPMGSLKLRLCLIGMSWCFSCLADYLWVPSVAYMKDNGLGAKFLGVVYALNLGARFLPNLLITKWGTKIEFFMMASVVCGYLTSFLYPTTWTFCVMALSSGMGFVRACLTVHLQSGFDDETLATTSKQCGAARNCGSIAALIVPALLYQHFGWRVVCCGACSAALLYILLACIVRMEKKVRPTEGMESMQPGEHPSEISWIDWMVGSAFIITELQYNIGNAAIPQALTNTFNMSVGAVGPTLGSFNAISTLFLALLPSVPCALLQKSPLNIVVSFFLVLICWIFAAVAATQPEHGLPVFVMSILFFTLSINMAQVLMLEYLSGVLDTKGAEKLMGVSETLGCGFAMLGGYLGDELEVYGSAAPFVMQGAVALLTLITLGASLAHRHVTRDNLEADLESNEAQSKSLKKLSFRHQLAEGLKRIAVSQSTNDLASMERKYRQHSAQMDRLVEPLLGDAISIT